MMSGPLVADTTPGNKYILLVTDGEPDYCGDGQPFCPPDSVICRLQPLKPTGITTIVFGCQPHVPDLAPRTLDAFATAGAGEPTLAPLRQKHQARRVLRSVLETGAAIRQRTGVGRRTSSRSQPTPPARPIEPLQGSDVGTYCTTTGPTEPYRPDPTNQQALITQLARALSGVKSCVFDLTPVEVNHTSLSEASVQIEGKTVPLDAAKANGWNMNTDLQLELFGSACTIWRAPNTDTIDFGFPCDIIVA